MPFDVETLGGSLLYFVNFLLLCLASYTYHLVLCENKNRMIQAVFFLLVAFTAEYFVLFFVKTMSLIGWYVHIVEYRNFVYYPLRIATFFALVYFLNASTTRIKN